MSVKLGIFGMTTALFCAVHFVRSVLIGATIVLSSGAALAQSPKSFATPAEASQQLVAAIKASDEAQLAAMFGAALKDWMNSGDQVADQAARASFIASFERRNGIEQPSANKAIIVTGEDQFPFPVPLVKSANGRWAFDPNGGKQEMIDRRVGRNERLTIGTLLAIGDAQMEFATLNSERTGVAVYAQRFVSTAGTQDGLYWPTSGSAPRSPLGELVATASLDGYRVGNKPTGAPSLPFNGYRFRMLFEQGNQAPGGAYSYLVNGRMIGGFAVIAWPVKYGVSGFKTFMMSHDLVVYESDLGPSTDARVATIKTFNPDKSWSRADTKR